MKTITQTVFCLFFSFLVISANGQTSPCTANTPHFTIDLTGQPGGTAFIAPLARQGLCCSATAPDACIMATITLDSNSSGIRFDISSGAVPPGALYYQIGCNNPTQVGEPICLNGPGPHILTFCKPGNNQNGYSITALPKHIVPDTVRVDVGCSVDIGTLGYFIDTTLRWTDLSSNDGRYLDYLDCTSACDTVTVTPDINSPGIIQYEVCGTLIDTVCQTGSSTMCKTVTVVVNSIVDSTTNVICQGESFTLPDGSTVDTSGVYVTSLASASGCDSTIITELTVNPTHYQYDSLEQCDSALVQGNWYYSTQVVIDSFLTHLGCDSVIETAVTINHRAETYLAHTCCDSALVNGNYYYTSQWVTDLFTTVNGCDSFVHTDVTIIYSKESYLDPIACDSAEINGNWYYGSQLVIDSFSTAEGCDSLVFSDLTINYRIDLEQDLHGCDSALVNGNWYYETQMVVDRFNTIHGCDSVITTYLTISNSQRTYEEQVACEAAFIDGIWYNSSTNLVKQLTTSEGCDSIVEVRIIIHYEDETEEEIVACDSLEYKGNRYFETTSFNEISVNQNGCDSTHRVYLRLNHSIERSEDLVKCVGESIQLPDSRIIRRDGIFRSVLQTHHGCDSTIITNARFNSTGYIPVPDTAKCRGDVIEVVAGEGVDIVSYEWNTGETGQSISTKEIADFTVIVRSSNGCSSVDTIAVLDANCPACPVYTPTAFTANNDYLNEGFKPISHCEFDSYTFEIYNRWGEKLVSSSDPEYRWDGTYMDKRVQQGVYVWLLNYTDTKSLKPISQKGTVTLLR